MPSSILSPPNQLEEALVDWTRTLGAVSALVEIELKPDCLLLMSGFDLCDYYCYCYKVRKFHARRNAWAFPLTPQQAASFQCFDQIMWQHQKLYPCLSTLAMGDNQAVELGQCARINLGIIAAAFHQSELLTIHGRAPGGATACGVVIDDVLISEQVCPVPAVEGLTEGEIRLDKICEWYLQRGLGRTFEKLPRRSARPSAGGP